MDELAVPPQDVRVDEDVPDRSVLAAEAGLVLVPVAEGVGVGAIDFGAIFLDESVGNGLVGTAEAFRGWGNYLEAPLTYCGIVCVVLLPQAFFIELVGWKLLLAAETDFLVQLVQPFVKFVLFLPHVLEQPGVVGKGVLLLILDENVLIRHDRWEWQQRPDQHAPGAETAVKDAAGVTGL